MAKMKMLTGGGVEEEWEPKEFLADVMAKAEKSSLHIMGFPTFKAQDPLTVQVAYHAMLLHKLASFLLEKEKSK